MGATAAARRRMRVDKVIDLRRKKREAIISDARGSSSNLKKETYFVRSTEISSSEIKEQRRIRNRESAIRYRERRQQELETLEEKVAALEKETRYLRERLSQYESPAFINSSNHTASIAF